MENNLVTSKEILEQAGISRATLNNYIKLGILPRPIVSTPRPDEVGVKQIGYFPVESLQWIRQVKSLKSQGRSMDEIAGLFQDKEWVKKIGGMSPPKSGLQASKDHGKQRERRQSKTGALHVTIENLSSPAYLVNNNLEIEWVNESAEELIFHRKIHALVDVEERNVFRLLFAPHSHGAIANWSDLLELHCTLLQRNLNDEELSRCFAGMTGEETDLLHTGYRNRKSPAVDNLYHLPFSLVDTVSGKRKQFFVHSETFREGVFVVFLPADEESSAVLEMLAQRKKIIRELLDNRMVSMLPLCTLVATIQDPERVCAELLPSLYFQLVNELWQAVTPVLEKYSGTYGNHSGHEMLYYFIKKHDNKYIINSVNCAIELTNVVSLLSNKWQKKCVLSSPLSVNVGIHEGREFFGTIRSRANVEFAAMGDSVKIARRLSEFGSGGEIWTTKDLVTKIPAGERGSFTFGIYRNQAKGKVLQRDTFSLAGDLIGDDIPTGRVLEPITRLAITEISARTSTQ